MKATGLEMSNSLQMLHTPPDSSYQFSRVLKKSCICNDLGKYSGTVKGVRDPRDRIRKLQLEACTSFKLW
jgi:hypothetical protein